MTDLEYTLWRMREHAKRLVRLLEDPHVGLPTWTFAVEQELLGIGKHRVVQECPPEYCTVPVPVLDT
jgi:hypothetical protein